MSSAFAALCLAFAALHLLTFLDSQCGAGTGTGTTTSAEGPLLHAAAEVLPPLAAIVVLFVAVALTYRRLSSTHAGAGNGRRSISGRLVMFALCASAGTLQFIVFVGAGGAGHGARARALGLAAIRALPAAATATFFCGMMGIIVAHVRAGGEGTFAGTGAVAGDGPIQGLQRVFTKIAAGAAAALVGLMVLVLTLHGAKY